MFKSARWRTDKNKIKAEFKLQFHATQLTQTGTEALMIAVIPGDVGKPTARLDKTKIKDGNCYWEKPHYETVKFTQDQKTGKFNEKIYRFVVATGSSVFGVVGEVSIDFSSYVESTKLSSLSLPLKNAKSSSLLHVSIQRVQDQRDVDVIENTNEDNKFLKAQYNNDDIERNIITDNTEDKINRNRGVSNGSDITLSCSDSSSGLLTPRDLEPKNPNKSVHESSTTIIYEEQHQKSSSQWDWLDNSPHELSTDDSSVISPREITEEDSPDSIIKKLQEELAVFTRQADMSEMELQTLRKQIVKESKKSQDLSRELVCLKEECEKMKAKEVKVKVNGDSGGDPWVLVDELKQELNYEKDLNLNLRLQLQKTQESNAELILAVKDLDEMLQQKGSVTFIPPKLQEIKFKSETDDDEDQKALEDIVREHSGLKDEQKLIDLYNEIELYKRDKEDLETQMEQIALDYEILKQENHDMFYKLEQSQLQEQLKMQYECSSPYVSVSELESQIENLENEVKLKSKELLESNVVIKELETHVKNLEEELENQALGFEADMEELVRAKVEQEQRAIRSEENLRKVKLQNANTAGKLQGEFRRLSTEMSSAFKENENAAMKAIDEAYQLHVEKRQLEEMLKEVQEDLQYVRDQYEDKLFDLNNQMIVKSKQLEDMEEQIKNLEDQKASNGAKIENLENERKNLEDEVNLVYMELESSRKEFSEVRNDKKDKENEIERLQLEIERLKSRCNDMKKFFKECELEKENLMKKVSQLNNDLKKKDETITSIEKKLKDCNTKTTPRNNKPVPVSRGPKEVTNMKDKIKLLESQIKVKETALELSEASFLEKEKDLQQKIEELERRLQILDQDTKNPQVSTTESSNPTITSDDAILSENKKTENQEIFDTLSNRNKLMEIELKEMQERYSEISLKFAEVEGERQQLVMTLRNLKNSKKF